MFTFTVRSVQIKKIVAFDRVLLNEVGYKIYSWQKGENHLWVFADNAVFQHACEVYVLEFRLNGNLLQSGQILLLGKLVD